MDNRDSATWLSVAMSPGVARTAFRVSLVVGTVLNAVNLGEHLAHGIDGPTAARAFANYAVPYAVATYAAVSQLRGDR